MLKEQSKIQAWVLEQMPLKLESRHGCKVIFIFFLQGGLAASLWNLDFVSAGIASELFLQSGPRGHFRFVIRSGTTAWADLDTA